MFSGELTRIGYKPYPSKTNFVTIPFRSSQETKKVFAFLRKHDIIVLPPWDKEFTKMPRNTLRVSIGTDVQMQKFLSLFKTYVKNL